MKRQTDRQPNIFVHFFHTCMSTDIHVLIHAHTSIAAADILAASQFVYMTAAAVHVPPTSPPSPLPTTNRWVNTPYSPPPPPLPLPLPLPLSSPLAVVKRRIFIHANFAFYFLTSTFIWSAPEAPSWVCVCACAWLCVCQDEEWYAAMLDDKWRAILNDLYCPLPCPPQAIGSLCPFLPPALPLSLSLARFSSFDRS